MRSPFRTPFGAVFQNEVLLNSKRIAPYALMILFSFNAVMWSVWGAAVSVGWATNSDFYIARNFKGFAFGILGLPLFAALIMADPVIRDFRLGIDSLIFSKPVSRAAYLLGKFFGSFFVLVCCQGAFGLTMLLLQVFHTSRMIVLPFRVVPYFKHFFFLVVISYLLFAAVYFTVGTLTRNAKIVYGLAFFYYPLYIACQLVLSQRLPLRWRILLDPLLFGSGPDRAFERSADYLNQFVVSYTSDMIANRALVIALAVACLTILYFRFSIAEPAEKKSHFSLVDLSPAVDRVHCDPETLGAPFGHQFESFGLRTKDGMAGTRLPAVTTANKGKRANLRKLVGATGLELSLLQAERSLVVIIPLAILFSFLSLPFSAEASGPSPSASFASHTANGVLLFLLGVIVFYTGEAMHRDREVRLQPLLWAAPVANNVLLLSKFLTMLFLTLSLVVLAGLTAIVTQLLKGLTPVEIPPYLIIFLVILVPSLVFMVSVSIALNVLLRDKYLVYAVSIGAGAGLFYLYSQGHNHWLYNPVLYQLWSYVDLAGAGGNRATILIHRVYCLAIASACLSLAHFCLPRKSTKSLLVNGRLSGAGWAVSVAAVSVASAVILGLLIEKAI